MAMALRSAVAQARAGCVQAALAPSQLLAPLLHPSEVPRSASAALQPLPCALTAAPVLTPTPLRRVWHAPAPTRGFAASVGAHPLRASDRPDLQQQPASFSEPQAPPVIISPQVCRVVVIGWMGSKQRYLRKYAHLWQRSGDHEVLCLRTTIPMTLLRWRGVITAGTDTDKVAKLHLQNPSMPTIYHIFSMGGFIHAGTIWRWMDQVDDDVLRDLLIGETKGIIFDSTPAGIHADKATQAIVSALFGQSASGLAGWAQPFVSLLQPVLQWWLRSKGVRIRQEEVYDAWEDLAPICPQLYLYSSADPLVPAEDVEEWIAAQKSRGVDVYSHKWTDSGHCEHYRVHPHEYAFQISKFMSHALRRKQAKEEDQQQ